METALPERKRALRAKMRERLARLAPGERAARSARLVARLTREPAFVSARRLLLFAPLPGEPDLDLLWVGDTLAGKQCAYPRMDGERLRLCFVEGLGELAPTRWGLREPGPPAAREADLEEFDLALVPGVAFDGAGGRLGRGGGYYDRLLAGRAGRVLAMGIGFNFQRLAELPLAAHDARLDALCTDDFSSPG